MESTSIWAEEVLRKIRKKIQWVSEKQKYAIPYTTDLNGNYDDRSSEKTKWNTDDGINWWTNGFWGGIMWQLYNDTKNPEYMEIAKISEAKLTKCFDDFYGLHHDVGFMFLPTAVADYTLTQNAESKKIAMHAANLLAGRYNPIGQYIRAWNDIENSDTRGWAIIDCLFNIPLLYWATRESGDPRFKQIAMLHTDTVMKNFVRPDGSVCHIVEFDPYTGEMIKSLAGQGFSEGSSWTRGQGWALYGFTISYIHTQKTEYLNTAKKIALYCIASIPENGIIPVDFRQPHEPAYEDSCGACVIACGLIELSRHVSDLEKDFYLKPAIKILNTLSQSRADWSEKCDAIIQNCSASYHNINHHITMVYADYFFIEAIYKLLNKDMHIW